jgi:hypothetical protein
VRSIRTGAAGIVVACAIALGVPAGALAVPAGGERQAVAAAKPCSAGYTHAVTPDGAHKCLRAGQYCSHKRGWQRAYHRYGFHCKRNGRLTYY